MAIHALNALKDIADGKETLGNIQTGLAFSCWTEDLELDAYMKFRDLTNADDLEGCKAFAASLIPFYAQIWDAFGRPTTREAWNRARSGFDETLQTLYDCNLSGIQWNGYCPGDAALRAAGFMKACEFVPVAFLDLNTGEIVNF